MNFLNTNVILSKSSAVNNASNITKILKLIESKISSRPDILNNTSSKIEYLGEGINGSLYKIDKKLKVLNEGEYYVVKVFKFNEDVKNKIKKELSILKKLEMNEFARGVINPCLHTIITNKSIITLFDSFNGMTLKEFIKQCHRPELKEKACGTLLKFCFKQIFICLNRIHMLNIAHLQLSNESILVKLNVDDAMRNNLTGNNSANINDETNIDVVDVNNNKNSNLNAKLLKLGVEKDKLIPKNSKIYKLGDGISSQPLVIKFTNFGLGCGKLNNLSLMNNTLESNTIEAKCSLTGLPLLDPYLLGSIKHNMSDLELGMHYDFFNIGLIGLMCIVNYKYYTNEFLDLDNLKNHLSSVSNWKIFLKDCESQIIENDYFKYYYINLCKYCLGKLQDRKNSKYVQESILLDEKYGNTANEFNF